MKLKTLLLTSLFAGSIQAATVGDLVWYDSNANGIQDAGEPGIEGVQVDVTDGDGILVQSVLSGTNGTYQISIDDPGIYTFWIDYVNTGLEPTTEQNVTLDLNVGESITYVDFGLSEPRQTIPLAVSGLEAERVNSTSYSVQFYITDQSASGQSVQIKNLTNAVFKAKGKRNGTEDQVQCNVPNSFTLINNADMSYICTVLSGKLRRGPQIVEVSFDVGSVVYKTTAQVKL